jgi:hypothetical protein
MEVNGSKNGHPSLPYLGNFLQGDHECEVGISSDEAQCKYSVDTNKKKKLLQQIICNHLYNVSFP